MADCIAWGGGGRRTEHQECDLVMMHLIKRYKKEKSSEKDQPISSRGERRKGNLDNVEL